MRGQHRTTPPAFVANVVSPHRSATALGNGPIALFVPAARLVRVSRADAVPAPHGCNRARGVLARGAAGSLRASNALQWARLLLAGKGKADLPGNVWARIEEPYVLGRGGYHYAMDVSLWHGDGGVIV